MGAWGAKGGVLFPAVLWCSPCRKSDIVAVTLFGLRAVPGTVEIHLKEDGPVFSEQDRISFGSAQPLFGGKKKSGAWERIKKER